MLKKRPFEFPGEKAIRVICDTMNVMTSFVLHIFG